MENSITFNFISTHSRYLFKMLIKWVAFPVTMPSGMQIFYLHVTGRNQKPLKECRPLEL